MFGGLVQYDVGKRLVDESSARTEHPNKTPPVLNAKVRKLQVQDSRVRNINISIGDDLDIPEYVKFFAFRDAILSAS